MILIMIFTINMSFSDDFNDDFLIIIFSRDFNGDFVITTYLVDDFNSDFLTLKQEE